MKKIVLIITIIVLASCGQPGSKNSKSDAGNTSSSIISIPADWKKYAHNNYSIQYAPSWSLKENQNGAQFILFSPIDSGTPGFDVNINLVIQDLRGRDIDLDKYTEISINQIKTNTTSDSILLNKKLKDSTGEYQHMIYSVNYNNSHLIWDQYYRIINDEAYLLTLTSLKEQWDHNQILGEQILSTFSVKK